MPSIDVTTIKNAIATWIINTSGLPADRVLWEGQPAPESSGNTQAWISIGRFSWTNPGNDWSKYTKRNFTFADKPVTFNAGTDQGTSTAHGLTTRDGPIRFTTTGSLAGTNLAVGTDYWTIRTGPDTVKFATSFLNADAGVFVDIQGTGTGAHSIVSTANTLQAGKELTETSWGARRVTFNVTCFPPLPATDATEAVTILSDVAAKVWLGMYLAPLQAANIGLLDSGTPQPVGGIQNAVYFEPRAVMTVVFATTSEVTGTETIVDYVGAQNETTLDTFTVDDHIPPNTP